MVRIRKAKSEEADQIKNLADSETETIGFVPKAAIREGIDQGYVLVAVVEGEVVGFQQYYHRKRDRQTTLYRKVVSKTWRDKGIGTKLTRFVLNESKRLGRDKLVLKCPVDNPSNVFHKKFGFKLIRTEEGKKRRLNIYEYRL